MGYNANLRNCPRSPTAEKFVQCASQLVPLRHKPREDEDANLPLILLFVCLITLSHLGIPYHIR